jgi:hypothetical protein
MTLMLLDSLPHAFILLNTNLLAGVQFLKSTKIHRLLQKWENVLVESLPVWVAQVVLLALRTELVLGLSERYDSPSYRE